MSTGLNDGTNGTRYDVPLFFLEEYPLFIEFMDTFFDWIYNQQGFTQVELESYLDDTSWMDPTSTKDLMHQLIDLKRLDPPGAAGRATLDHKLLTRDFDLIKALDCEDLQDADGRSIFAMDDHEEAIELHYEDFGFQKTADYAFEYYVEYKTLEGFNFLTADGEKYNVGVTDKKRRNLDHSRWLKLLKHVYRIRGTQKATELFFWLYFGAPIRVSYPKEKIARLDDNFVLDGDNTLRDDNYYNEYSYVIKVPGDVERYQGVFDKIYRRHFHPTGFTVFLESFQTGV